jgi:hypothetical protein
MTAPNFARLDGDRPEITRLVPAMLQAREALALQSWSHPPEYTGEEWWADVPVPTGCSIDGALPISALRLSAVRDYTGTLPQCKAIARPPLAGGFVGCHRHRQIINISDTLNHVAARVQAVDAVSEIRPGGCHKGESARKRGALVFTRIFGI